MTQKTRAIDFATISLRDALDLAVLVEEEAKERYSELADQMELHHNPDAAAFFRRMIAIEAKHENRLAERRRSLFGNEPRQVRREMIFDVEAPDYDEARANMTVRQALEASLRSEKKAFEFFVEALEKVELAAVKELFAELRDDEREHHGLVEKELAKLPPEPDIPFLDEDEIIAL